MTSKLTTMFSRLFGADDAQPTAAQVREQIGRLETQLASLRDDLAVNTAEQATFYGSDTTSLKQKAALIREDIDAALNARARLEAALPPAEKRDFAALYAAHCAEEARAAQDKADAQAQVNTLSAQLDALNAQLQTARYRLRGLQQERISLYARKGSDGANLLTGLEFKRIEHQHGLANDEELRGAEDYERRMTPATEGGARRTVDSGADAVERLARMVEDAS